MNISPNEAEETLAAIQKVSQKTRRSLISSGSNIFLFVSGLIWLVGFLSTHFLPASIAVNIWIAAILLGSALSILLGSRLGSYWRGPATADYAKRIGVFWVFLVLFGIAAIAVAQPIDEMQQTMMIILFIMLGQLAMSLLFTFSSIWWVLPITALALVGYFFFPDIFYLWMGLVGAGMVVLAIFIRSRW